MEIILLEDINGLGYRDDIVTVKNGYGLNYLIPGGKAKLATESTKKCLEEELKQRAKKLAKIKAEAEAKAEGMKGIELTIVAKAAENGSIFGSVTTSQIADELKKKGVDVDKKTISINTAVKQLGGYIAIIKLHKEVSAEIPFTVVAAE